MKQIRYHSVLLLWHPLMQTSFNDAVALMAASGSAVPTACLLGVLKASRACFC